jgi:hypothetical protein
MRENISQGRRQKQTTYKEVAEKNNVCVETTIKEVS